MTTELVPPPSLHEALAVLHAVRREQIVVTTMSPAREWMKLGSHPRDFVYTPSAMGHAPGVGLGLALAQPGVQVIVCNGDGSMLMNLGALVTATAAAPPNYVLLLCDNGVYEVTGRQPTVAVPAGRRQRDALDWCGLARQCGFPSTWEFRDLAAWRAEVQHVLAAPGPTFVRLVVAAEPGAVVPKSPAPPRDRARTFRSQWLAP